MRWYSKSSLFNASFINEMLFKIKHICPKYNKTNIYAVGSAKANMRSQFKLFTPLTEVRLFFIITA